jgi:hypothetical protein
VRDEQIGQQSVLVSKEAETELGVEVPHVTFSKDLYPEGAILSLGAMVAAGPHGWGIRAREIDFGASQDHEESRQTRLFLPHVR